MGKVMYFFLFIAEVLNQIMHWRHAHAHAHARACAWTHCLEPFSLELINAPLDTACKK